MNTSNTLKNRCSGFSLIEVLIGILIFAIGMMALAQLQSHLARNSSDSNARTVAINIAEELIESARVFGLIDSDGTIAAYNDIVDATSTITREGNIYEVTTEVTDYYYDIATDEFTTTPIAGVGRSDFKLVELTVTWNDGQEFQVDQQNQTSGRLGSGSIQLSDVISSITSSSGGKIALNATGGSYAPPVNFDPDANPDDLISIKLGNNKFKVSTTPLPDVKRIDELVETRFDVVTYSQIPGDSALFLRREEFLAVSCECTLRIPGSDGEGGLRPTIWEGSEYSDAEFVKKPYGEITNDNQQSDFCGICCRDHHDGGAVQEGEISDPGRAKYNPFQSGDHEHYSRVLQGPLKGTLEIADSDGDSYVEACRLIRKDGFFRVAQNLRQEGLNAFPEDYLDGENRPDEVAQYSTYITDAVTQYEDSVWGVTKYELSPPTLTAAADMAPTPVVFPASTFIEPSIMEPDGLSEQQLRARGIYIDYMSEVLQKKVGCLLNRVSVGCDDIDVPNVTNFLEIIPFYDVQLTWLARWNESPNNIPVDVTNEPIASDNLHSRGVASLYGKGLSTVSAVTHKGNLGLTGTDPIDPGYTNDLGSKFMYIWSLDPDAPPPLTNAIISGTISTAIPGQRASDVNISAEYAQCDRTSTGYECVIEVSSRTPTITFTNYDKANKRLVACATALEYNGNLVGAKSWTKYDLPKVMTPFADIVITEEADCTQ